MDYKLEYKPVGFGTDPETKKQNQGLSGQFFIPAYQRGYRWTKNDVKKLLSDISESSLNGIKHYSLQPIVVKKREDNDWELIDGQQRLTTLWLIFNYMYINGYRRSGAAYQLQYETRTDSREYLQKLDEQQALENIDYFHLRGAHDAIEKWFSCANSDQAKEALVNRIYSYLSDSVHVIWYEVPEKEKPIPLFTRLNQGRIPLTDAELLKAVLLTHAAKNRQESETEIAAQWDGMERDLRRPEIWAFVAGNAQADTRYSTRISLLFDTLAQEDKPTDGTPPRYHTFDTLRDQAATDGLGFWKRVVTLHAQILGWMEEPHWYNKIGFLVFCGMSIGEIQKTGARGRKKSDFDAWLDEAIKDKLRIEADDLPVLSYDTNSDHEKLLRALLLFNVLTCREQERFPFEKHAGHAWTLEHIHAQNAQNLTNVEQWKVWLNEHLTALEIVGATDDSLLSEINTFTKALEEKEDGLGPRFNDLAGRIQAKLTLGGEGVDHTIANLALLPHEVNSALSNAVFEVKRQKIVDSDKRGDYIPVATRNVFLKYYTPANNLQPHFWGQVDKDEYLKTIQEKLKDYL